MKRSFTELSLDLLVKALLVASVFILVQLELPLLAIVFVLLSKWQMFLAHRRYWWPNLVANSCDIIVGLVTVGYLINYTQFSTQILVSVLYFIWLTAIKPRSEKIYVVLQAAICQFLALSGLFLFPVFNEGWQVIILSWVVGWISANHFFNAFEERSKKLLTHGWAIIVAEMSWLFWQWSLVYFLPEPLPPLPQIAVFTTVIAYCYASIYNDHSNKQLNKKRLSFHVSFCLGLLVAIIVLTDWDVVI